MTPRLARGVEGALFAATYVALDLAGRALLGQWTIGLPWYPPAGVALAYFVTRGARGLPWLLLARLALAAASGRAVPAADAVINGLLAGLLTLAVAPRFRRLPLSRGTGAAAWRTADAARFFALSLGTGAAYALLAAGHAAVAGHAPPGGYAVFVARYGLGDAVGIAVVFPAATLVWPVVATTLRERRARWLGIGAVAAGTGVAVMLLEAHTGVRAFYLALLPLAWAATRGGMAGAAIASVALDGALTMMWALAQHAAPVAATPLFELQAFMLVAAAGALLLGGATSALDRELAQRRETESRLRAVVEQSVAGFYTIVDDRFVFANHHFAALLGYTPEELLAMPSAFDSVAPEDQARVRASIARRLDGRDDAAHHVFQAVRKDGARIVLEAHSVAAEIGGRRGIVGALIDRTALASTEAALRERDEQLRQAQKLEAVGRLAGGVAHDFNNMLTAIGANVTIALQELAETRAATPAARDSLAEIRDATARAAALTRQLLAFGRKQVLRPRAVRLDDAVRDALPLLRRLVEADVRLDAALGAGPATCLVDPTQLEQVVLNLVVNARDAVRDSAEKQVTVATFRADVAADARCTPPAGCPPLRPGRYAAITVADTGRGIDDATRQRMFEPFFTTKPVGEGTGLGLATVFGIVQQSGGTIHVDSAPGRGATFTVYLPAVDDVAHADEPARAARAAPAAPADAVAAVAEPRTVLVVEDEDVVRRVARRALERAGYAVLDAATPGEALRRWPAIAAGVHAVVSDVVMPEMDGVRLAAALRERRPDLRVLLVSGYSESLLGAHGPLPPDTGWLSKPFTARELCDAVAELLDDAPEAPASPAAPGHP